VPPEPCTPGNGDAVNVRSRDRETRSTPGTDFASTPGAMSAESVASSDHTLPGPDAGARYTPHRPEQTLLHRTIREQLGGFLARSAERGHPVPRFVEQELRAFLRCGVLAHGFLRLRCDDCGCDRLVPFSCKRRGFCPACGGRRMADTAAHLADRVLPEVPIRQWVLTLPYPLRYRCAYDAKLASEVLRAFVRALFAELRRRSRQHWGVRAQQCGAVTFIQRFGSARAPPESSRQARETNRAPRAPEARPPESTRATPHGMVESAPATPAPSPRRGLT